MRSSVLSFFSPRSTATLLVWLADTPPSDVATFRLHGALLALLRAYLPPRAAKMWQDACDDFPG
jgi:hypothetical protein